MFAYIAGDIMSRGSQWELEQITAICRKLGIDYYSPIDNKSINDKKSVSVEENNKLAEKILREDTARLERADLIIFNCKSHAIGTLVEIGQVLGMADKKHCVVLYDDIRRTDLPEVGDRRSWSINQYLYGAILKLTGGKGITDFADLETELCAILEDRSV